MVIAVGNLSAGGTGKSPMTEYLIRLLHHKYALAALSRGYKRKSKGFLIANEYCTVDEIGDEPYQMYLKYNKVAKIAVGEERSIAIPNILLEHPETQIIIMDDGYQHRTVRPDYSVLLSDYNHLFFDDHLLPWGRLREAKVGARRAQTVVITKCPANLSEQEQTEITNKVRRYGGPDMLVFFSRIVYSKPKTVSGSNEPLDKVIGFAGLANTELFESHLRDKFQLLEMASYNDHYNYSTEDINELVKKAEKAGAALVTTEKDVVKFRDKQKIKLLNNIPLYYIAIEHQFIKDGNVFDEQIEDAITDKYTEEEEDH